MDRPTPILFELRIDPPEALARLKAVLSDGPSTFLTDDPSPVATRTYLDTFDGRLHRAGRLLAFTPGRRGGRLELETLDGELVRRARSDEPHAFAEQLPPGPLAEEVVSVIAPRRLLPVAELRDPGVGLRLVDELDKTVVRLDLLGGTVAPGDGPWLWGDRPPAPAPMPPLLLVRPVRGYEEAFQAAISLLEDRLAEELARATDDILTQALAVLGRGPRDYSSKLRLELDPEASAEAATREILWTLLATMRANEEGTRLDLDPELLHDFRVAVRRTRAVLGQVRGVFPAADVARFKKGFAWLGGATGPTRDLDVYLLKLPDYRAGLPRRIQPHLDPLGTFLQEHQRIEQAKLARLLRTKRYRTLLRDWEAFLKREPREEEQEEAPGTENARRPIRQVASERIWKAWQRVRRRGAKITSESEAAELHRLRIACKKLRYLLEVFRSLAPADQLQPPIQALKKLQDNLGDFNDYEVQQKRVAAFADQMVNEDLAPVPTLLAMGRLQARLDRGQRKERRRFEKRFRRFTSKDQRRRLEKLFKPDATVEC